MKNIKELPFFPKVEEVKTELSGDDYLLIQKICIRKNILL